MRQSEFEGWLVRQGYKSGTISSRIANCMRVEMFEGDLDYHFQTDGLSALLKRLHFSKHDQNNNKNALHSIPISGDIYNGTATLRSAVNLYAEFCSGTKTHNTGVAHIKVVQRTSFASEKKPIDSYDKFLSKFNISKEEFFQFGIDNTITPDIELVSKYWTELKERLFSGDIVYIRGAGREAKGTQIYLEFYSSFFKNQNITKDPTNNLKPQQILQAITGYRRNENIFNYQVSHTFGRTKNPLMFEAPWNLAFVPKMIDPLTGHETQGDWPIEYQEIYTKKIRKDYLEFIDDYNKTIQTYDVEGELNRFVQRIDTSQYSDKQIQEFMKGIRNELSVI